MRHSLCSDGAELDIVKIRCIIVMVDYLNAQLDNLEFGFDTSTLKQVETITYT